ncbi:DUF4221 family protein [Belliella marina]|uniref:DUF4221 family protein n=1 Tax=Belliella marina TaxID=1644146 RepID=A0ABW4VK63_9BACT
MRYINDKIVLGSNISSSLYVLDLSQNKLEYITIDHQLTNLERTYKLPKEVSDPEESFSLYKKTESEISFGEPVWDATNGHYFRLSHVNHFETSTTGYPSPTKVDTYLNILDKNFKLQAEIPLPSRKSTPGFYFAKDGKFWIFENMDDEMGFVRIKVD